MQRDPVDADRQVRGVARAHDVGETLNARVQQRGMDAVRADLGGLRVGKGDLGQQFVGALAEAPQTAQARTEVEAAFAEEGVVRLGADLVAAASANPVEVGEGVVHVGQSGATAGVQPPSVVDRAATEDLERHSAVLWSEDRLDRARLVAVDDERLVDHDVVEDGPTRAKHLGRSGEGRFDERRRREDGGSEHPMVVEIGDRLAIDRGFERRGRQW